MNKSRVSFRIAVPQWEAEESLEGLCRLFKEDVGASDEIAFFAYETHPATTRSGRRRACVRCPSFFCGPRGRLWHLPVARSARRTQADRGCRGLHVWAGPAIPACRRERTSASRRSKRPRFARDIHAGMDRDKIAQLSRADAGHALDGLSVPAESPLYPQFQPKPQQADSIRYLQPPPVIHDNFGRRCVPRFSGFCATEQVKQAGSPLSW